MPSSWQVVKSGGRDMDAYHSMPEGNGPFSAVVVIHHGGGVDRFVQETANKLAANGYAALAPNLFHRLTDDILAEDPHRVHHLKDPEVAADIDAAIDWLKGQTSVGCPRIGVVGFSMGGRAAWLAAVNPRVTAAVPYYGEDITAPWGEGSQAPLCLSSSIGCPILFHFGEDDQNPSQAHMRELDAELTRLGKPHRFYTYPEAGHGFMDRTSVGYRKNAAQVSWFRTMEFLSEHLAQPGKS